MKWQVYAPKLTRWLDMPDESAARFLQQINNCLVRCVYTGR